MVIRKADTGNDIVGSTELASDGYYVYLSSTLVSTNSPPNTIVINLPSDGEGILYGRDHPVSPQDIVHLYGTSGGAADGYYFVFSVLTDTSFTIVPPIAASTGGNIDFIYPAGATVVGFDPTGLTITNSITVEGAIKDIDANAVTFTNHPLLRQLIHFIDEGPADGFASDAFKETTPIGVMLPTYVAWYEDNTKLKLIVDQTIMWDGIVPITITWQVYKTDGVTVAHSVSDSITYANNIFEHTRTRTII